MLRTWCVIAVMFWSQISLAERIQAIAETWPWEVSEVHMQKIDDNPSADILSTNECARLNSFEMLFGDGIDWSQVVTIGNKIWDIVKAGKPVIHLQTPVTHVLPMGLECWTDLEHWQAPRTQTYEVIYKNGFGMEVVKFRFRLHYTAGGGKAEKGQFLANVSVLPAELNVTWLYSFDAKVEVMQAVNMGSRENPMAGLELNLRWNVKTVVKESENSFHFFVQGDGVSRTAE